MNPQGLIFASGKNSQMQLHEILLGRGLPSFATSNVERAEVCLYTCGIVVAILEWTGEKTSDAKTCDLVKTIFRSHPQVRCVVFNRASGDREVLRIIHSIHPEAWIHDAALGDTHLAIRLDAALGKMVGDLCVRGGSVLHLPTEQKLCTNRTALQLVLAAPGEVRVDEAVGPMAVLRFRRWLEKVGSCVVIESEHGTGRYRLVVSEDSRPVSAFQRPYLNVVEAA